ncbi:uncharacterized protein A1O9_03022 [Exophiala aquamarina CBS 119918]|uniref:Heterokaryon incompatibility domain-containing protein n=1 Tax=Exophiala aquamarina CBS 119918 TaxID=1182545 RepID=A0A072PNI9_9EURO|nr:uncharacterized protein A1O9_03022 [Exophiala aquamarina CBS 119918]KEF61456.1 hypothetical protein A1O9_03022 [Exophiala aquamarina CBS 119918]
MHQRHHTRNSGMLSGILFSIPIAGSEAEYHALSYTWGKDEKKEAISTNLGLVYVTANLDSAIRRLLCDYGPGICVWADALCINQDDAREKSRQIRLMPSIYSNANLVVAYLGREDEDSEAAIELVKKINEISLEKTKPKPNGFDDLESCGLPRKDDQTWTAFQRFVSRAWFRRVWIIQEFVLARNIILLWGLGRHLRFEALIVTVLQIAKLGFVPFVFAYHNSNKPPPLN